MADETKPEFTNTELKTIDELAFRLKAADKSAQAINTQLERFITDNHRATLETEKKLSEQNSLLKQQQKTLQTPKKEEAKPIQPINVGKEEDLFFEDTPITPVEPEPQTPQSSTTTQPSPALQPIVQEAPVPISANTETEKETSGAELKNLQSSVTNVENNSYSIMPETVERIEKVVEKEKSSEPIVVEPPVAPPQIIEKTVPITNTVTNIEKTIEKVPVQEPPASPTVVERPVAPEPVVAESLPEQKSSQIPVVLPPQPSPTVNVTVTESAPTTTSLPVPEMNIPQVVTAPPEVTPSTSESAVTAQPSISIPEISTQLPPPPPPPEFTAAALPPAAEIPPIITEPEVKKPEMGLNLADESLVSLNKGIEKIAALLNQNQSKLIASIDALNNSVGEILKMLPTLQSTSSESNARPSQGKTNKIDSSSIISNYRQGLGLTTKSFTSNTVFPGGNSIS